MMSKYEKMGYKITIITFDEKNKLVWAIKKRPIARVSDLSYENITHISAAKLCEVLGRNFGGGWDSLSQSIRDIIESGFDISTTTLPTNRLHKPGGMYDKKEDDIEFEEPSDFDDDDINEDTYRTTFTISEDEEDPEGLEILDSDE